MNLFQDIITTELQFSVTKIMEINKKIRVFYILDKKIRVFYVVGSQLKTSLPYPSTVLLLVQSSHMDIISFIM